MKSQQPTNGRHHKTKPVDGIIVEGLRARTGKSAKRWIQNTWVLTASPDESLAEFFLEEFDGSSTWSSAHRPVICRGITEDGALILGKIHLSSDRFLSSIFSTEAEK